MRLSVGKTKFGLESLDNIEAIVILMRCCRKTHYITLWLSQERNLLILYWGESTVWNLEDSLFENLIINHHNVLLQMIFN